MAQDDSKTKTPEILKPIEWEAEEFDYFPKGNDWFWATGIISAAIFIAAIFLKNFLIGVLSLLAGFSIMLFGAKKPEKIKFKIGAKGIEIKNRIYPYENLRCFWINYDPPYNKELILESQKTFLPHIIINIENIDPALMRNYLLQFLKEEKLNESLTSALIKMLRF